MEHLNMIQHDHHDPKNRPKPTLNILNPSQLLRFLLATFTFSHASVFYSWLGRPNRVSPGFQLSLSTPPLPLQVQDL